VSGADRSRGRLALAVVPAIAYMAVIFVLSSRPPPRAVTDLGVRDTFLHLVEYAVLGFLLARLVAVLRGDVSLAITVCLPAVLGTLYGLSDEWHQSFVPGRDASSADAVMDAAGAFLGALAHWVLVRASRS
jgi:VanZ family protein